MKTQREIIYSIIEFVSGFHVTDDNPYDENLISKKIDDVRATLIKQEYNEKRSVNDLYYQECEVDIEEKTEINTFKDEDSIQFYVEFPELLSSVNWDNIKYLGKKNFKEKYNRRSINGFMSGSLRRYSHKLIDYTVVGPNKAFIRNEADAKDIILFGLFKTPSDVSKSLDVPYPVPDSFKLEMIVKQDIAAAMGVKADEENDAKHNQEQILGQQ